MGEANTDCNNDAAALVAEVIPGERIPAEVLHFARTEVVRIAARKGRTFAFETVAGELRADWKARNISFDPDIPHTLLLNLVEHGVLKYEDANMLSLDQERAMAFLGPEVLSET